MEKSNSVKKVMDSPRPTMDDLSIANMLKSHQSELIFKSDNEINPMLVRMMKFSKYPAQMMSYIQSKGWDKKFGTSIDSICRLVPGDVIINYNGLMGIVSIEPTENDGKYLVNLMYLNNWDTANNKPYVDSEIERLTWLNSIADEDKVTISEPVSIDNACRLIVASLDAIIPKEVKVTVGYNARSGKIEVNMGSTDYYRQPWNERFEAVMSDIRKDMKAAGISVEIHNSEACDAGCDRVG